MARAVIRLRYRRHRRPPAKNGTVNFLISPRCPKCSGFPVNDPVDAQHRLQHRDRPAWMCGSDLSGRNVHRARVRARMALYLARSGRAPAGCRDRRDQQRLRFRTGAFTPAQKLAAVTSCRAHEADHEFGSQRHRLRHGFQPTEGCSRGPVLRRRDTRGGTRRPLRTPGGTERARGERNANGALGLGGNQSAPCRSS